MVRPASCSTPPAAPAAGPAPARVDRRRRRAGQPPKLLHRGDERVDLHRPAALEVLQHRGLVRADRAGAVDAPVDVDREAARRARSAIASASTIIARATARVPGSPAISSSVPPVSAEIGLKREVAPELDPDLVADVRADRRRAGRPRPAPARAPARARSSRPTARRAAAGRPRRGGSTPGASISGRRIDDAADGALRADRVPDLSARDRPPRCAGPHARRRACRNTTRARRSAP